MPYRIVLQECGREKELGYFKYKKEATEAVRYLKKNYRQDDEDLQERLAMGLAGYKIEKYNYGLKEAINDLEKYGKKY